MLIDTGAQISLIHNKIIPNKSLINTKNKFKICSIHGSEDTLGNISTKIRKNNTTIPIQLQVTTNTFLKEDGILGYDIIGEKAIIDGPNKTFTLHAGNSSLEFPINPNQQTDNYHLTNINEEIDKFHQIEYLSEKEIKPEYETNLLKIRTITREISSDKIEILPPKNCVK